MKRLLYTFITAFLCLIAQAQTPYYFYNYKGEKLYLSLNTQHAFLSVKEQQLPVNIQQRNIAATKLRSDRSDQKEYQAKRGTSLFSGLVLDDAGCRLNVSFLSAGVYMVSVFGETRNVFKIIKN